MTKLASENNKPIVKATISVAAQASEFAGVRTEVMDFSERAGLPGDTGHQITLVLEELFANLLNHGGGKDGADITLRRDSATVHIRYRDDGAPFNPLDAPEPGLEGGAEKRAVGGLGVHLVRQLTDTAVYRRADGRNILELEMALAAPE